MDRLWSRPPARAVQVEATVKGDYDYSPIVDLASLSPMKRRRLRKGNYRLYVNLSSPSVRAWTALLLEPRVRCHAEALIGGRALKATGLFFEWGTQQGLHADTWYGLGGSRPGKMIGAWFALDDTAPTIGNGPLMYLQRSHRLGPSCPESCRGACRPSCMPGLLLNTIAQRKASRELYEDVIWRANHNNLSVHAICAKAGDVVLWHESLLHGGWDIRSWNRTRRSLVFHFNAAPVESGEMGRSGRALMRRPPRARCGQRGRRWTPAHASCWDPWQFEMLT
uniref:Phytanoyl-CoA dioxygenase n=1 Tax=Alexandrium catenella TaxID=2925 RepID=A0A7S1MG38_ALECA